MSERFNEEEKVNTDSADTESEYAYKTVIKSKENRRTWSVASLSLAVLSVLTLLLQPWVSLIFGALSVGAGIMSRKNLGYFDKLTLAGIIIGIFGIVFSLGGILFGSLLASLFVR